jgi:hypothetical protein
MLTALPANALTTIIMVGVGSTAIAAGPSTTTFANSVNATCTKYQAFFDSVSRSHHDLLERVAAQGDTQGYSTFRYALDGLVAMAAGTGDPKYVEQALRWSETIISKAIVTDYQGYRNWAGRWSSPNAPTPIDTHLKDIGIGVALSEVARLVLRNPSAIPKHRIRAAAIRNFVAKHIIEKHLVARADRSWHEAQSVSTTGSLSTRTPQILRAIVNLSQIGDDTELAWTKRIVADWKRHHFEPWRKDAIIWDLKRGAEAPGHSWDTSHAFPVPYYFVRAAEAGLESELPVAQLSKLLLETIWNKSMTNPMFTNFIDGTNEPVRTRGPWELGVIYGGWVTLGAYNPGVQAVMEAVLNALIMRHRNPSLDAMNSVWGKLELAGHVTRNLRILGKCD